MSLQNYLYIALEAAVSAGKRLKAGSDELRNVKHSDAKDVKLRADMDSEELIRKLLSDKSDFPIIGEEQGGDESLLEKEEYYWIVDPLDGTSNYLTRVPLCCVSIALMKGTTPVLGVIHDFNYEETFSGIVGEGFWVNGEVVQPSWSEKVADAALVTGFPAAMNYEKEGLEYFFSNVQNFKKVRAIGTAALAMAWVSNGRFDSYFESSVRLWDVAAGIALIRAAGGYCKMQKSDTGAFLAYDVWAAGSENLINP